MERSTTAFLPDWIGKLRKENALTPQRARELAAEYLAALPAQQVTPPPGLVLTDQRSDTQLDELRELSAQHHGPGLPHREIFWLVPMALAAKLQDASQFQAALDWYQTVYAYHLPQPRRRIYHGLEIESHLTSSYGRLPEWLIKELNPHVFALERRDCYTRATVMTTVGCFLDFADAEFTRGSDDARARARTLYATAAELLARPEARPEVGGTVPFPANPLWDSLLGRSLAGLTKLHHGLNIAGAAVPGVAGESVLPSQHRFAVLVERAKNLVAMAQQVEAAYLSALEQRDARTYDEMRARNDLQVAAATKVLHELKVADAGTGVALATLQRGRAQLQESHFQHQLDRGYSAWESAGLLAMGAAAAFHAASVVAFGTGGILESAKTVLSFGLLGSPGNDFGQMLSAAASAAATGGQIALTVASFERREEEWRFQRNLAQQDGAIADQQVQLAVNQQQLAPIPFS